MTRYVSEIDPSDPEIIESIHMTLPSFDESYSPSATGLTRAKSGKVRCRNTAAHVKWIESMISVSDGHCSDTQRVIDQHLWIKVSVE